MGRDLKITVVGSTGTLTAGSASFHSPNFKRLVKHLYSFPTQQIHFLATTYVPTQATTLTLT